MHSLTSQSDIYVNINTNNNVMCHNVKAMWIKDAKKSILPQKLKLLCLSMDADLWDSLYLLQSA